MPQQIIPLTDDELMAVADEPEAQGKFTSEERRRLNRLRAQSPQNAASPSTADNIRNVLQWGGKVIGGAFFGPAGVEAVENPGATLASAAIPGVVSGARKVLPGAVATGAEFVSRHPTAVGAAAGSVPGIVTGSPTAAVTGALLGADRSGRLGRHAGRLAQRMRGVNPSSAAAEAPVASSALPTASPRGAPAPPAAPEVPPSVPTRAGVPEPSPGQQLSAQRIRNEVGLAERRAGLKLTEGQREQADRLVAQGQSPKEAVQAVVGPEAPAPTTTTTPASRAPAATIGALRPRLTAAEVKEYQRMIQAGKTPKEAQEAIELQRQFAQQYKTPSVEQAFQKRDMRNATGRWPKDD